MRHLTRAIKVAMAVLLIAFGVWFSAAQIVPSVMGWMPTAVRTGSMAPAYPPGSAVILKMVSGADQSAELQPGDVIAYMPEPGDTTLVTHRIVGISQNADVTRSFTTQGDANSTVDDYEHPITYEQVRGKVLYSVPWYGHVLAATPGWFMVYGKLAALGLIAVFVLYQVVTFIFGKGEDELDAAARAATAS